MRGKTIREAFLFLPTAAAFALLLFRGEIAAAAAKNGIESCLHSVIPALFPFLVLTNLFLRSGISDHFPSSLGSVFEKLFHIRRAALPAFLAGMAGGYPSGAAAAAESCRLGHCSKEEAERLLVFANNCSPGFLFGLVSTRLSGGVCQALLLLLLQWMISACLGVVMGIAHPVSCSDKGRTGSAGRSFAGLITSSVIAGGRSVLMICAYVVFFSVISAFLPESALLRGTIELTGGVLLLKGGWYSDVIAAFLLGFGGLSVACQVISALEGSGVSPRRYLPFRLLHGLLMAIGATCLHFGVWFLLIFSAAFGAAVFFLVFCRKKTAIEV